MRSNLLVFILFIFSSSSLGGQSRAIYGLDSFSTSDSGWLYDNGSDTGNYASTASQSCFTITGCKSLAVVANMKVLKLVSGNGILHLYDGTDSQARRITPKEGIHAGNQVGWRGKIIHAHSGSIFVKFEASNASSDSGFALFWKLLNDTHASPKAVFYTLCDTVYTGHSTRFFGDAQYPINSMQWEYFSPGNSNLSSSRNMEFTFLNPGNETLCIAARTCTGADTFCKTFRVVDVTDTVDLDFTSSDMAPEVDGAVQLISISCKASNYYWSIQPAAYTLLNGTSLNAENPQIAFLKDTCYTIRLTAWNAILGKVKSERTLVKKAVVCAKAYKNTYISGRIHKYFPTTVGFYNLDFKDSIIQHRNSTKAYEMLSSSVPIDFYCNEEKLIKIVPNPPADTFQLAIWIDQNRDGVFSATDEKLVGGLIYTAAPIEFVSSLTQSHVFSQAYGTTRMRIAMAAPTASISTDTILGDGSFTDVVFHKKRRFEAPIIHQKWNDTVEVQSAVQSSACFIPIVGDNIWATDKYEGDISSNIILETNIDCSKAGWYYLKATVCNCAGICSEKYTSIRVVKDSTPPHIDLNSADTICHEINTNYVSIQPTVIDPPNAPGDVILVASGAVNTAKKGMYIETFTATDKAGNITVKNRYILVDSCQALSQNPLEYAKHILVYPNPATHQLYIKNNNTSVQTIRIHLLDYTGRLIYETELPASAQEQAIPLNNVPSGSYLVLIQQGTDIFKYNVVIIK